MEWGGGCYSKWCNGATEHIFGFHSELAELLRSCIKVAQYDSIRQG